MPPDPTPLDLDAIAEALAEKLAGVAVKRYLSVAEAAAYSSLSPDSVRTLLTSGKLTALRPVPGRVLIDRRQLDSLILGSTRTPRQRRGVYGRDAG
jgi:excisionase family DNA binding protein